MKESGKGLLISTLTALNQVHPHHLSLSPGSSERPRFSSKSYTVFHGKVRDLQEAKIGSSGLSEEQALLILKFAENCPAVIIRRRMSG